MMTITMFGDDNPSRLQQQPIPSSSSASLTGVVSHNPSSSSSSDSDGEHVSAR